MELQHFSHEHTLILGEVNDDGGEPIVCKGCWQNISGSAYSCQNCSFFLHKWCAKLPKEIKHPFHEMDPLTLEESRSGTYCDVCGERVHGFTYRCYPCNFDVDIRCTLRAQHFSHKHQLILLHHQNEEKKNEDGETVSCDGCLQPITGSAAAYRCTICSISLHKLCGELPTEMQHQMHPEHPLALLAIEPYKFRCDSCDAYSKALIAYRCTLCNFNLDVSCALRAEIVEHERHKHPLSLIPSSSSFECHACRTKREDISYMCTNICNFWIHESCISLPTTFKHSSHAHDLTLIYSIPDYSHFSRCECRVCDEKLQRGSFCWFYACDGCEYYIHVNCSSKTKERKIAIKIENLDEANLIHLPMSADQSVNLIDQFVKQISLRDIKREVKDNYCSHDHPLILFDAQGDNNLCSRNELLILNEQKNKKICNACVRQISAPFYSCSLCDFFLHKWCAELPNELKHPCHQHQLILLKNVPEPKGIFWCDCCGKYCKGFAFKCVKCKDYSLDVKCACLPSVIIHKVHECPLFLKTDCIDEGCVACPRSIRMFSFGCDNCNFYLHYTCALLPHTIKHRYDKHPFTLIYAPIEDGSEEYICEFCEEEIDPKLWFYHCIHCDQSACATCIYDENCKDLENFYDCYC